MGKGSRVWVGVTSEGEMGVEGILDNGEIMGKRNG